VYDTMASLLESVRSGGGPAALEAKTTRFFGHFEGDPMLYRAKDEVARHREQMDCLRIFRDRVSKEGWLQLAELDAIDAEVMALIEQSVATSRAAVPPSASDLLTDVYVSY
jgi:pyruvate dehydrogenase E1 component alpha subunit